MASWQPQQAGDTFSTTQWSLIARASADQSSDALLALNELCRCYWEPLHQYILRRGHHPEDARDLVQQFFATFISADFVSRVHPSKGKFRAFLLASLKNFLVNEHLRNTAQKRGGAIQHVAADEHLAMDVEGAAQGESFDRQFDREWARLLLERATQRLAAEYAKGEKARVFDALKGFLADMGDERAYAAAGQPVRLSASATSVAVCRLRERYRQYVREEVANTVTTPEEVNDEMRYLLAVITA